MKIIRTFIFPLLFLFIIFLILELISIKLFPEYSQNQIFKTNFKTEKGFSRISKSKIQHFHYFKNLKTRSKKNSMDDVYNENLSTIWLFGDSVTNGYGLKYTDTYYHSLEKYLNLNNKRFNVLSISEYDNNIDNIVDIIEKNQKIFKSDDFLIFQFNYNDILPSSNNTTTTNNITTRSEKGFLRKLISGFDPIRFEYLHRSTFLRVLTHYASIVKRKTSGDCKTRGIGALGQYTFSYGSLKYSEESKTAWNLFERKILQLKELTNKKKLKFIVLISPISLQLENHQKLNFHNYDLKCSTIDGREQILDILKNNNIQFSDPLKLFEETTKIDIEEGNFEPLFFEYDTNHPNSKGSLLISITLLDSILNF